MTPINATAKQVIRFQNKVIAVPGDRLELEKITIGYKILRVQRWGQTWTELFHPCFVPSAHIKL